MTPFLRRLSILTFLALPCTADLTAQTWSQVFPNSPGARRSGGLEYDAVNGNLLMYGGLKSPTAITDELWAYDGNAWTPVTPTTTMAPPRWGHRLVRDTRRNVLVTFGGRSPSTTTNARDTWEWDGRDWAQVMTPTQPPAVAFYSMTYDARRGVVVRYGSQSGFPNGDQTWEYDGTDWQQVMTATNPQGRETPGFAYDAGRGVIVMFGGWNGLTATEYADTWEYDGTDWVNVTPVGTNPPGRSRTTMLYDENRGRIVLYGGLGGGQALTDTWEWDGSTWTQTASTGPALSTEGYMAHDPLRNSGVTVFFGGSGPGGVSDATWEYDGPDTALFKPFGPGCAGSNGAPALQAGSLPQIGTVFTVNAVNLPVTATSCLLFTGISNTFWGPLPLPWDVGGLLGPCRLEVAITVDPATLPVNAGSATVSAPLPNATPLIGVQLYLQVFAPDAGSSSGIGTLSRAAHVVVGL